MPSAKRTASSIQNRLLAALPTEEYKGLLRNLEQVTLPFGRVLYEPGDAIRHVYFLNYGIVSLLCAVGDRASIEVATVGNEGVVGIPLFLGVSTALSSAIVQSAGSAMRLTAEAIRAGFSQGSSLQGLLQRYTHALLTQVSQSVACNRFHTVDARLARCLLMTRDRSQSNEIQLTQEFLSRMLGVRREGVTLAAIALQKKKLIRYRYGHITILSRAGLEAVSCKCYRIVKNEYDRFLGS